MTAAIAIIQALIAGVPKIVELVKQGRDPKGIKLGEVISTDALDKLSESKADAADFIANG